MVSAQRIAPLASEQWDPRIREILDSADIEGERLGDLNIFRTLANHPSLLRSWMRFGAELLFSGELDARDRELLILRTAHNCGSPYEWAQHARIALEAGITSEEITRVASGPGAVEWSEDDRTLLQAADELAEEAVVSDATWSELADRYTDRQLIELVMLVGQYHLVAFLLNSLRVQLESGFERYAPPGAGEGPGSTASS